jgi:hypothetical protein
MSNISQRLKVIAFLKKNVIGRSVIAPPQTTYIDGDKIVATYEEDAIFTNLNESARGFSFDMTTLARGSRYIKGDKLLAEGTMNTVRVIRYEMTERLSTGDVLGFSRFISSTNNYPDPFAGTIFHVRMIIEDDVLYVEENHVGYADFPLTNGKFKPIATEGHYTYTSEKNKLVIKYQQKTFIVDPKTFNRTPTNEVYPVQVSSEIIFPEPLETIEY